jgi:hypothetical protein
MWQRPPQHATALALRFDGIRKIAHPLYMAISRGDCPSLVTHLVSAGEDINFLAHGNSLTLETVTPLSWGDYVCEESSHSASPEQ